MSRDDFYKSLGLDRNYKKKDQEELYNLYKPVKRDKGLNRGHQKSYIPFYEQQMDLLMLPEDEGYKYALVVVDVNTGITDAEPLKNKDSETVAKGLKKIYSRNIMKETPTIARTDSGSEFKGAVKKFFKNMHILHSTAQPGRHRQLAFVERRNYTIGSALFFRMIGQEIITGAISKEWVKDLPVVIEYINKNVKPQKKPLSDMPVQNEDNIDLIEVGTKVRTALDNPIDLLTRKTLHGKFRGSDIKWDPKVKTVTNILVTPDNPPFYKVDDVRVGYTKNQLQIVQNERKPKGEVIIRGEPDKYIPEKILSEKKIKGSLYFLVKWSGFKEPTYSLAKDLIEDQPKLVKAYRDSKT